MSKEQNPFQQGEERSYPQITPKIILEYVRNKLGVVLGRRRNINELKQGYVRDIEVGSLLNPHDRQRAARLMTDGNVIGVFNRGVNALWVDGSNDEAVRKLQEAKGEAREGRPVALTIRFDKFIEMVDRASLAPDVRRFLEFYSDTNRNLKTELGSLCFLRAPLQAKYVDQVPQSSISKDEQGRVWIQTWDPHGHKPTEQLLSLVDSNGVEFPAVTSMNVSGEPELVDQNMGELFCREKGIPLYLKDPKARPDLQGSYTIITMNERGFELTRDGNIPGRIVAPIFGTDLLTDITRPSKYSQLEFPEELTEGLSPAGIRMAVLLYLNGRDPLQVNERLRRYRAFNS